MSIENLEEKLVAMRVRRVILNKTDCTGVTIDIYYDQLHSVTVLR